MEIFLQKYWKLIVGIIIGVFLVGGIGVWIGRSGQELVSLEVVEENQAKLNHLEEKLLAIKKEPAPLSPFEEELLAISELSLDDAIDGLMNILSNSKLHTNILDTYNWRSRTDAYYYILRNLYNGTIVASDFSFVPSENITPDLIVIEKRVHAYLHRLWSIDDGGWQDERRSIILACADDTSNFYYRQGACALILADKLHEKQD
jgi:hypothetical protein